jgi:hypothetical protein
MEAIVLTFIEVAGLTVASASIEEVGPMVGIVLTLIEVVGLTIASASIEEVGPMMAECFCTERTVLERSIAQNANR